MGRFQKSANKGHSRFYPIVSGSSNSAKRNTIDINWSPSEKRGPGKLIDSPERSCPTEILIKIIENLTQLIPNQSFFFLRNSFFVNKTSKSVESIPTLDPCYTRPRYDYEDEMKSSSSFGAEFQYHHMENPNRPCDYLGGTVPVEHEE